MDIAELAARLAEKSNKSGRAATPAQTPDGRGKDKGGTGKKAKPQSAEKRPSIAKKASAGRRSVPRTSGK
ncbi:MAG TPA: hypothetical protein VH061_01395 [Solirubrobacteraceae bacterium]|jgi:hypothetical protein|nr:hypothetical protein [Solirubrobacteraceae bacterium]